MIVLPRQKWGDVLGGTTGTDQEVCGYRPTNAESTSIVDLPIAVDRTSKWEPPATYKFGFATSTGLFTDVHLIRTVRVQQSDAPSALPAPPPPAPELTPTGANVIGLVFGGLALMGVGAATLVL